MKDLSKNLSNTISDLNKSRTSMFGFSLSGWQDYLTWFVHPENGFVVQENP